MRPAVRSSLEIQTRQVNPQPKRAALKILKKSRFSLKNDRNYGFFHADLDNYLQQFTHAIRPRGGQSTSNSAAAFEHNAPQIANG